MAVAFFRGTTLGPDDLDIIIRDTGGTPIDPFSIKYAIYDNTTGVEVLIGSPAATPVKISTGHYYADFAVPGDANVGDWLIRWTIQETAVSPVVQSVQEFNIVADSVVLSFTGDAGLDGLIKSLRILLRDNNPDRNYRFRPPEREQFIQGFTQVFGFIWEDEELLEYLYMAVDDFNTRPPVTGITINDIVSGPMRRWRTSILLRAGAFACFAVAMNWIADEFSVAGEESVVVKTEDGEEITVTMEELFAIVYQEELDKIQHNVKEAIVSLYD